MVVGFVIGRAAVAEGGVASEAVVEPLDVVEDGRLGMLSRGQTARCNSSDLSVAKKLSAAALSKQVPGRPTLERIPYAASWPM